MNSPVQFIIDANSVRQSVIIPISLYNELVEIKKELTFFKPVQQETYSFKVKQASASGFPKGDVSKPAFVVQRGSTACFGNVDSFRSSIKELRNELLEQTYIVENKGLLEFVKEY